jgi:hypothetical protein
MSWWSTERTRGAPISDQQVHENERWQPLWGYAGKNLFPTDRGMWSNDNGTAHAPTLEALTKCGDDEEQLCPPSIVAITTTHLCLFGTLFIRCDVLK